MALRIITKEDFRAEVEARREREREMTKAAIERGDIERMREAALHIINTIPYEAPIGFRFPEISWF